MTRRAVARTAGAVWCAVALGLFARAAGFWGLARTHDHRSGAALGATLAAAVVVGLLKGRFVLRRSAARNLARIAALPEPLRPWQAFSPWYGLLVAGMIALGLGVRAAAGHGWLGGWAGALGIYVAVATALATSSAEYFRGTSPRPTTIRPF